MDFLDELKEKLERISPKDLSYNQDEEWMYSYAYDYLEYYAIKKELINTCLALKAARHLHNDKHRKLTVSKDGVDYRLPYIIHPLLVTRMLADLHLPIGKEDEDILLASSLCHDTIEDAGFENGGRELVDVYMLDERIYQNVKAVSKRYDFTPEEEKAFFHNIESNWITLLVKLADRGQNVEDMYNMTSWKVHEYIGETEKFFMPMCTYGLMHYPKIIAQISILQDKILTLTKISSYLVDKYDDKLKNLREDINRLQKENDKLKEEWKNSWEVIHE